LIDQLTTIDCPLPGASGTGTFGGFLAEPDSAKPSMSLLFEQKDGTLSAPVSCRPAVVQKIMWLGPAVLPALINHLGDRRPTKLAVGQGAFLQRFFGDEYDPRHLIWVEYRCQDDPLCSGSARRITGPYTVRVGDICFALIGQIVNRNLNAVRYQPTGLMFVNSPIESPALSKRVRADWAGIDGEGLKKSLLADLHLAKLDGSSDAKTYSGLLNSVHSGALRRLRYFYPRTYATLTGTDLERRNDFERRERAGRED
jgi:hypothetical protein